MTTLSSFRRPTRLLPRCFQPRAAHVTRPLTPLSCPAPALFPEPSQNTRTAFAILASTRTASTIRGAFHRQPLPLPPVQSTNSPAVLADLCNQNEMRAQLHADPDPASLRATRTLFRASPTEVSRVRSLRSKQRSAFVQRDHSRRTRYPNPIRSSTSCHNRVSAGGWRTHNGQIPLSGLSTRLPGQSPTHVGHTTHASPRRET